MSQYSKFYVAVVLGVLAALNACLDITTGTAHNVVTVILVGLNAILVFLVPNGTPVARRQVQ